MQIRLFRYSTPLAGIAALTLLAGCSGDVAGTNRHIVKISFMTNTPVAASANHLASDLVVGPAGDLVLTRMQLVFGKLELDRAGDADCVGAEESDDDHPHGEECEDVSRDPLLVNVPLDGALLQAIDVPLAAGTYRELEAKLSPARERATAFNTAHPDLVGKSIRVEGTYKGTPFVFASRVRARVEMEFDPPLVIDETTKNATISMDVSRWFMDASGEAIDPSSATEGSVALLQIQNNIRRSFHAFEDDDERGEDNHEGHRHGNGDGH
jgi:hypothetical protein